MPSLIASIEDLPENIIIDIISRLPVKKIIQCKCVSKKWGNLVMDSYFANILLSRSPACFMIHHQYQGEVTSDSDEDVFSITKPGVLSWLETIAELKHQSLHRDSVNRFDFNHASVFKNTSMRLVGSVNGLICLLQFRNDIFNTGIYDTCICNPVTREWMVLSRQQHFIKGLERKLFSYGFGVGLKKKEYKVIRIFQESIPPSESQPLLLEAEIYTLGSGQWRSLGNAPYWLNGSYERFLNGRVHWIVRDSDTAEKLCSFDFDNEIFQLFPSPPVKSIDKTYLSCQSLGVLKGCLCHCDLLNKVELRIWVMKEYGIKESWHKEVVIKNCSPTLDRMLTIQVFVIEILEDGSVLMVFNYDELFKYCPRSNTFEDSFDPLLTGIVYRPGFLKLQNFKSESVHTL